MGIDIYVKKNCGFCKQAENLLKKRKVKVLDSVDEGYGKFAWLLDPNGVKIELWQQVAAPE